MKAFLSMLMIAGLIVQGLAMDKQSAPSEAIWRGSEQTPSQSSRAEEYLSRLANNLRTRRRVAGIAGTLVGAAGLAGGIALLSNKDDEGLAEFFSDVFGLACIGVGGVLFVGGVVSLAVPTRAEKEDRRVRAIGDAAERGQAAASALAGLAKWGRRNRMIMGGLCSAAAVLSAVSGSGTNSSGDVVGGSIVFGAAALYSFLVRSSEEKTYRDYSEERPSRPAPELAFGLAPHGGVQVGLTVTF
jgi:hypothetical protein